MAALLTLFAVRVAVRPPDRDHQYGHGKAEHLAALGESAFLMLVSLVIAYASLRRLIDGGGHEIEVTWWAFTVLAVVIVMDASRATISYRASRRYHSPALAANALHFASDLVGSFAVLVGLVFVSAGERLGGLGGSAVRRRARRARCAAARQAVGGRAHGPQRRWTPTSASGRHSPELDEQVELRRMRVRHAAGRHFVDIVVGVPLDAGVSQAHAIADEIEERVERALGGADVVVHVEPSDAEGDVRERATAAASAIPEVREVHNVRVMRLPDGYELSLHVKLPRELSLEQAHDAVERLENRVREEVPEVRYVHTHIEPLARTDWARSPDTDETAVEREAIESAVRRFTGSSPLAVSFRDGEQGRVALVTVSLPGDQPLPSAHEHAGAIEEAVRERCPGLADVIVHTEPMGAEAP